MVVLWGNKRFLVHDNHEEQAKQSWMQTFYFKGKTDFLKREQLDERPINKTCNMIILSYRANNYILDNFYLYKACIYEKVTRKTVRYFINIMDSSCLWV